MEKRIPSIPFLLCSALTAAADYPNVTEIDFSKFPNYGKDNGKILDVAATGQ